MASSRRRRQSVFSFFIFFPKVFRTTLFRTTGIFPSIVPTTYIICSHPMPKPKSSRHIRDKGHQPDKQEFRYPLPDTHRPIFMIFFARSWVRIPSSTLEGLRKGDLFCLSTSHTDVPALMPLYATHDDTPDAVLSTRRQRDTDAVKKNTDPTTFRMIGPACPESDSGGIRTRDPQLRRLLLYPTELRNHRRRYSAAWSVQK